MILKRNQERIILELAKSKGSDSITSLGKKISNTYMSTYYNVQELKLYGYVDLFRKKNISIVKLTSKGIKLSEVIINKNNILFTEK